MKTFVIDLAKCNGCYGCQLACKDETVGNAWAPYSCPQPNTGHFWLKMHEKVHGQVPKVRVEYRPALCRHCAEAPCIEAAPGAVYRREDGLVIVDPQASQGGRDLVDACPYGAIYYNEELDVPQKCTGCAHRVDEGELPHCVEACATGALRFGEEAEFEAELAVATEVFDVDGTAPRVRYLNPFGLFASGEVWDPSADLIVEGAQVILVDAEGTELQTTTDGFGDFWFWHLDPGSYRLRIEAGGFTPVERDVELAESINLGDFPLEK